MKKVKYLLGLFIFGLLINHCFGIDVEIVNTQFNTGFTQSNYSKSYSYLYRFTYGRDTCGVSTYSNKYNCLGDSLYYNKSLDYSRICSDGVTNFPTFPYVFNNSIFSLDVYTGWSYQPYTGGPYTRGNINCNQNLPLKVLFGSDGNFGKNVLYTNCYMGGSDCGGYSPKYFLGGPSFFVGYDWLEFQLSDIGNSFRVFFNSTVGNNIINDTNTNTPISWPSSFAWEYFTNTQTRTNFGYIVDSNGYKGKHFGSMGLGYSFVYNKDSQYSSNSISWNTLGFTTVYDDILVNLRSFGGLDILHNGGANSWADGILIFRKQQYTSNGDEGVIVISKNPNNTHQLLYQEFSCQTNNFNCISRGLSNGSDGNLTNYCPSYIINSGSSAYNPCLVLSQGILNYNGTSNILPFNSKNELVSISDSPILSYLFDTSSSMLGGTYTNGNQFCIGDNPTGNGICFSKVSSSDSIKENYLNGVYNNPYEYITSGDVSNGTYELCTTNAYFAAVNYEICHGLNPSDIVIISGAQYIIADVQYDDGLTLKQVIPLTDYYEGITTLSNGFTVSVCSSEHPCDVINSGSAYFSGGIIDSSYYSFDNTGLFFSCPYPYNSVLSYKGWNFNIGGFDIIGPINCMIAAFKHGRSFNMFDNVGLFDFGPLIQGNSQQHKILFSFFDVLLSLGFLLFFSLLYKRLK